MATMKKKKDPIPDIKTLNRILRPESVAVIGASNKKDTLGNLIFRSIIRNGYKGKVYPVSATSGTVMSVKAVKSIIDIDGTIDLAIIVVPATSVLKVARECGKKDVKGLVVISDGFKELGPEGAEMEIALRETAINYGMRILGPNCMGFINTDPDISLNASFCMALPDRGRMAFFSQSGALCVSLLKYSKNFNAGFSSILSAGNRSDIGPSDLLRYWENDDSTKVILLYLESFDNPEEFYQVAKRVSLKKPILALKGGITEAGAKAAFSHTGAMATDRAITDALFHRAGILRVESVQELFHSAMLLSGQPVPKGKRIAIITNGGGPGTIAADEAEAQGLNIEPFSKGLVERLNKKTLRPINIHNPLDLTAGTPDTEFVACARILIESPENDAVILIYVPPAGEGVSHIEAVIERLEPEAKKRGKSIIASFVGDTGLKGKRVNNDTFVPYFPFPEDAIKALENAVRYSDMISREQGVIPEFKNIDTEAGKRLINPFTVDTSNKPQWIPSDILNSLFTCYGILCAETLFANSPEETARATHKIGTPVAIKLVSSTITHKSEVGGVILDVKTEEDAIIAFNAIRGNLEKKCLSVEMRGVIVQRMITHGIELFMGVKNDKSAGHVIMFGAGGIYTELINDTVTRLLPLTDIDAEEMIGETRVKRMLTGYRGMPLMDINAIKELLLRISQMVKDIPEIIEMDINPVKVLPEGKGCLVLDARMLVE
jgi:acetyltransferase